MSEPVLTTVHCGDSAVLVRLAGADREPSWRTVQGLADALETAQVTGLVDLVATYDSLLVEFDCAETDHAAIAHAVRAAAQVLPDGWVTAPRQHRIPVVYGDVFGPDLHDVADELGLHPDELVRRHTETDWVVRFRGAPAGSPMLDGWSPPAPVRRRPSPRIRVPAGSVAVAGAQSVVYPVEAPGGWRLIGRTPARLVDVTRTPHVPYRPGDRFLFTAVPAAHWTGSAC